MVVFMTEKLPERRRPSKYSDTEREHALYVRAFARNDEEALKILEQEGIPNVPSLRTIQGWRLYSHKQLYMDIRERTAPERDQRALEKIDPIIDQGLQTIMKGMRLLDEQLDRGEVKDVAAAISKATIATGIMIDKKFQFEGRPTSQVVHLSGEQILRTLKASGRVEERADVDSTVEEDQ